ncbi:TPA: hypothetical protein P9459_000840, partial [Escherichia coli]|nr:hypothetical protein [Escherichia coli]
MKMRNNVFVFDSPYCLLIYCILFNHQLHDTIYIYSDNVSLRDINFPGKERYIIKKGNNKTSKIFYYFCFLFRLIINPKLRKLISNRKDYRFLGQDHLFFSKPFLNEFILLEDGLANYRYPHYSRLYELIIGGHTFGRSTKVNKILLSGMIDIIDPTINDKVEFFDLIAAWEKLNSVQKKEINHIFNYCIEDELVADVMILTQPLSEDGFISENEKIRLYDEIIKEYNDKKIVIRQHPRELTDYSLYFKDVKVNKVKAPVELVVLNSPMIKTAVTLFSGGIFNIPCREKIFKGT